MRATGTLFCTTAVSAGERSPMPAPEIRGRDDPGELVFECNHEKEELENMNNDSDHTREAFANAMNQSPRGE